VSQTFLLFLLAGFVAQLIDGALGMAYGVSCNSFLLTYGMAPALASASVKSAEVFTTAISGFSHFKLGNVDRSLFVRLLVPGVVGGVLGAYVLSGLPGDQLRPFVALYLFAMGLVILHKALRRVERRAEGRHHLVPLGFFGGFLDAVGGGGWGPVVTSTLMANGKEPRLAVGSVNLAEFFVTLAQLATFTALLGFQQARVVLALILGGVAAAPLAAHACRRVQPRTLMLMVGVLIVGLSLRTLAGVWPR
jgi:uncharacterized membrane protein YfcA